MSRLFYPTLFLVTAALAAMLWTRHGLPIEWLTAIDVRAAWGQATDSVDPSPAAETPGTPDRYGQNRSQFDRYGREGGGPAPAPPVRRHRGYTSLRSSPPPRPAALPETSGPDLPAPNTLASPRAAALPETAHRTRPSPISEALIEPPAAIRSLSGGRIPVEGSKVLARIGSTTVILAADVLPQVEEQMKHLPAMPREQYEMYREMLLQQQVVQLVQYKLIIGEMKNKFPADKLPEIKKHVATQFEKLQVPAMMKQYGVKTDAELDALFKSKGTTREKVREEAFESQLFKQWLEEEVKYDETVRHADLLAYYYEHIDDYKFPAKARFEELRVNFSKHRDKEEAWRLICELGNQVARGAPWAAVAKARSEGPHAETGGRYDWTSKGSLKTGEIDKAIFSLPIGQASLVIPDQRGYSIVRVVDRKDAGVESFEEAQVGIRDKIKAQRKKEARDVVVKKFFEKRQSIIWTAFQGTSLSGQPLSNAPSTAARPPSDGQPRRR